MKNFAELFSDVYLEAVFTGIEYSDDYAALSRQIQKKSEALKQVLPPDHLPLFDSQKKSFYELIQLVGKYSLLYGIQIGSLF